MKCPEIRNEIETIEDLKNKDHTTPDSVASHIEGCLNCGRYYKSSHELECVIFKKIKDIKGPVSIPAHQKLKKKEK